jgi:RNA polymerase sigma factor (sigma-70 family)
MLPDVMQPNQPLRILSSMSPREQELLLEEIHRNPEKFGRLFDHFYGAIFKYIFRRTRAYDISQDLAAETFLKAYLTINRFTWRGIPLSSWLFKIATNEVNQFFRKRAYEPAYLSQIADLNLHQYKQTAVDDREAFETELKEHEEFNLISQKLLMLDIKYQEVIALRYFEGKDVREISEILSKPEGTIKSLLSRGLAKLRLLVVTDATNQEH